MWLENMRISCVTSDLSCPAVSQSCRAMVVEPRVKVFIWKSIPRSSRPMVSYFTYIYTEECVNHCDNGVMIKEKLTDSSAHFTVEVSSAVVLDEGGLTHP